MAICITSDKQSNGTPATAGEGANGSLMANRGERTITGMGQGSYQIGTLNEMSLHSQLKDWYRESGDQVEVKLGGYVIDLLRGNRLIEIQTRSFSAIQRKLTALVASYRVRLVYPIPHRRWIIKLDSDGKTILSRRKSPKCAEPLDVFTELVSLPHLPAQPNFSLEILSIDEEEIRCCDGRGSWRRQGQRIVDRRLLEVTDRTLLEDTCHFLALIPSPLPDPYTTRDLVDLLDRPRWFAQKVAYCLRHMGLAEAVGREREGIVYRPLPAVN